MSLLEEWRLRDWETRKSIKALINVKSKKETKKSKEAWEALTDIKHMAKDSIKHKNIKL